MLKFKNNLFSIFLLLFSILIFIYTFYRSYIHFELKNLNGYYEYYLISIFLFFLSLATFYFPKKINNYIKIIFLSMFIFFYFFEAYFILSGGNNIFLKNSQPTKNKLKIYEKKYNKKYDLRTKEQVYKDLKKKNKNVVVSVGPKYDEFNNIFTLSNVSNEEIIFCNESGYYVNYKSDRFGFNNPDEQWNKKNYKYLVLGDSYGHGVCVNEDEDISSVLRKLSDEPVLNLSNSGNGPLVEYASLKEYYPDNVKYVIWLYFEGNDLQDLAFELNNKILRKYIVSDNFSQKLKFKQNIIDKILREKINYEYNKRKYTFIKFLKLQYLRSYIVMNLRNKINSKTNNLNQNNANTEYYEPWDENSLLFEFKNILKKTKKITNEKNSKLIFVYLPKYNINKKRVNKNFDKIKILVENLQIPFVNIDRLVFKKQKNPLDLIPLNYMGHYNSLGYYKVAKSIESYLN